MKSRRVALIALIAAIAALLWFTLRTTADDAQGDEDAQAEGTDARPAGLMAAKTGQGSQQPPAGVGAAVGDRVGKGRRRIGRGNPGRPGVRLHVVSRSELGAAPRGAVREGGSGRPLPTRRAAPGDVHPGSLPPPSTSPRSGTTTTTTIDCRCRPVKNARDWSSSSNRVACRSTASSRTSPAA